MPQPRRAKKTERGDYGWVISFGCKNTGTLRRLKVDTDPSSDTSPIEVPCPCGEAHRVTVSPYRRRRAADEPFDLRGHLARRAALSSRTSVLAAGARTRHGS